MDRGAAGQGQRQNQGAHVTWQLLVENPCELARQ